MRQFKLINANGQEFDLMRKDAFLHVPDGLGWGLDADVMEVGDTYVVTDRKPQRPSPSGEMVFSGYEQYNEFLSFSQVGGLVLAYKPLNTWQYLDVDISIEKDEIQSSSMKLVCPISFSASSHWYEKLEIYQSQTDSNSGKIYSYKYPYVYRSSVEGSVKIQNGNLSSYPRISIFGPVTNPTWALFQFGKRIATGTVNVTIPPGNKLVVDMRPATMEIAEYTENGIFVANRYQDSDFSTERIFSLPPGESRIAFTQSGVGNVKAFIEVRKRV